MNKVALAAATAAVVLVMAVGSASAANKGDWAPMGDQGARRGDMCWVVGSGGISTYQGYWAPCKK